MSQTTYDYDFQSTPPDVLIVKDGLKIWCPIIGIFLTSCACYVMISLIVHFVTSRTKAKTLKLRQAREQGSRRKKSKSRGAAKLSGWLGYLSLSGSIFAFLNCAVDHPSIFLRETSNKTCKILQSFSFLFYPCGVTCVYCFLWARQRVFYSSPTLGLLHSKYLRWTSLAILPIFLVFTTIGMITTLALYTYQTSSIGCIETSGNKSPTIILYVGALCMQATLLTLFVYPLKEHASDTDDDLPENKLMMSLIKRAFVTTGLCVLADTTAFIIIMLLPSNGPSIVVNLIRDGNLVVNVICVVCSFVDWRERLASICRSQVEEDTNQSGQIRLIKSVKSHSRSSASASSVNESKKIYNPVEVTT
ncbi:uncharacterized protein LOC120343031 [Styela clava]